MTQPVADVLLHCHVGKQCIVLKQQSHVARVGAPVVHVLGRDPDPTRIQGLEPRDETKRGGLPAAARPEQRNGLTLLDLERDILDRHQVAEALGDALDLDNLHSSSLRSDTFPGPPPSRPPLCDRNPRAAAVLSGDVLASHGCSPRWVLEWPCRNIAPRSPRRASVPCARQRILRSALAIDSKRSLIPREVSPKEWDWEHRRPSRPGFTSRTPSGQHRGSSS